MKLHVRSLAILGIVLVGAVFRLLPHPPNFTPIAAMALFAGAHVDRRVTAFLMPLLAMLLGDVAMELLFGRGFHGQLPVVYASIAAIVTLGRLLRGSQRLVAIGGSAVAASLLFFITTNLSVWAFSGMYPHTMPGFVACFVAALPFLENTLLGDLFYTGVFFGGFAVAQRRLPLLAPAARPLLSA